MNTVVIIPPSAIVSWDDAKAHLRLDGDDERTYVEALVAAAAGWIDGPGGWLGRAIGEQELETRFSKFCDRMELMAPVIKINAVEYIDENGASQSVAGDSCRVVGRSSRPQLAVAFGESWPSARCDDDAVRVRYSAGYPDVPSPIKQAILLLVGQWYEAREAVNIGNIVNELPFAVDALLGPFRVFR